MACTVLVRVFSSPKGAYRQAQSSIVLLSIISNDFYSDITMPIVTFHILPPEVRGTKNCSNCPGHMTNMGTMPIYGKNLKKSSPEPPD